MEAIRQSHPDSQVELWAEDEHRLGLKPIVRRVWAPRGKRPQAIQRPRYQWLYVYAFVRPSTGDIEWYLLPTVNADAFSRVLEDFARERQAGQNRRLVVVLDSAGFHVANDVRIPEGIHLVHQPAYSPEVQPSERLWTLVDEPIANRCFESIDLLEDRLADRCCILASSNDVIRRRTLFAWWPERPTAEGY